MSKDNYSTKSSRTKLYQTLNFIASFLEGKEDKLVFLDRGMFFLNNGLFSISLNINSLNLNTDNKLILKVDNELKEKIEKCSGSEELIKLFSKDEDNIRILYEFEKELNDKNEILKITNTADYVFSIEFKSELFDKLYEFMKNDDMGFHKYASIRIDESDKFILKYLKDQYELSVSDYLNLNIIKSLDGDYFDFYMPYEVFKNINKVDSLYATLHHTPHLRGNILNLDIVMNDSFINFRYLVMGKQNFLNKRN